MDAFSNSWEFLKVSSPCQVLVLKKTGVQIPWDRVDRQQKTREVMTNIMEENTKEALGNTVLFRRLSDDRFEAALYELLGYSLPFLGTGVLLNRGDRSSNEPGSSNEPESPVKTVHYTTECLIDAGFDRPRRPRRCSQKSSSRVDDDRLASERNLENSKERQDNRLQASEAEIARLLELLRQERQKNHRQDDLLRASEEVIVRLEQLLSQEQQKNQAMENMENENICLKDQFEFAEAKYRQWLQDREADIVIQRDQITTLTEKNAGLLRENTALADYAQEMATEIVIHYLDRGMRKSAGGPADSDVKLAYVQWFDAVGDVATENVRLFGKEWETAVAVSECPAYITPKA
ncbi:hypothetical protein B0H13DRAFT_1873249 [Mycena leptocephala]|nr:hypothetical protein B0H13DRAFT_1873249 [Mycena leptocephala]